MRERAAELREKIAHVCREVPRSARATRAQAQGRAANPKWRDDDGALIDSRCGETIDRADDKVSAANPYGHQRGVEPKPFFGGLGGRARNGTSDATVQRKANGRPLGVGGVKTVVFNGKAAGWSYADKGTVDKADVRVATLGGLDVVAHMDGRASPCQGG